ncbi:ubiquitin carboxyl-terminal hydrolase 17 [Nicotiana tomentosiformis]|uniref:ubiquitin carboxyl-terminal hydrolase 17 n=1 Tax=Nicotiana tomentosiformis TaxID=4098 RepID=UPI00051AC1A1|nr:ubiquitin carboxyl-terminal hydrolase 17-like [Nicotiana tomentosiformis]
MLVGGDLGFLSSLVVAAFVAVFGPVLGFVVRRKWRRSVARREEIKRLLVLASEEAARAELLAAEEYGYGYGGYSYDILKEDDVFVEPPASSAPPPPSSTTTSYSGSRQLQYQCAVCSSPTSTRCSQCKAVRYCSGKCQILHWRQGHKDECRPVSNTDHHNDVDATSHLNAYKQESNGSHLKSIEVEGRHSSESGDASPAEAAVLRSKHSATYDAKDVSNEQSLTEAKCPNLNSSYVLHSSQCEHLDLTASSESSVDLSASDSNDSDASDSHKSAIIAKVKSQANHSKVDGCKPPYREQPKLVSAADVVSTSGKYNPTKLIIHGDTQSKYWTSTSSSNDGSSESSSTEPSTPSSGFWEGAVPYTRSKIQSLDSIAYSPSRNACNTKISDFQSTSSQPPEMARPLVSEVGEHGSNSKKNLKNPNPITVERRKPVERAESRFEVKDETESRRSSASRSVTSNQLDVHDSSDKYTSTPEEGRYSSSGASGNLKNHDGLKVSSLPLSSPKKSYCGVEGSASVLQLPKDRQKESSPAKISGSHISSSNGRHEVQNVKSPRIDSTQVSSACSAESNVPLPNARSGLKSSVLKVVDQFRGSKLTRHNSLGDECEVVGRYGNKGLFPYESFVKLHNWKNELRPFGLVNCGNSCYANAVLQCLAFTPPLTSYFLQGLHSKTCEKKGWCFTCEFESLVLKAKDGTSPLSPISIISHLESIGSNLGNGREEDAHEFLRYVIDTMQSICLREAGVSASGSFEEETTLVGLMFGGYLRSKIECMRCGGKSERQERMMDLTVEIDGDIGTLEEALKQFTHTETLDGENKYRCGRCKSYEKAKKKLKVLEAPNVLTIALKRFQSGKFGKLNKTIKFPEILNLAPYMSGTRDKSPVYQLYGVVVHLDVMNAAFSGHYVCYVRNFQNRWFKVNDSSVKSVELERVLSEGAYMLLYSRCSPRAPRIMRSLAIPLDPRRSKQLACKSRSHTRSPWDSSHGDSTDQTCSECSYTSHTSVRPSRSIFEDDSSSEQSSSLFSEGASCSTESTNRDSTSTDELFDQIFGESGGCWNNPWRNSSDSDTSSSSSSPSPLYSKHSPLADLDRNASAHEETCSSCSDGAETAGDGHGFWTGLPDRNGYAGVRESNSRTPLCPNSSKHCRNLFSSHSSSKTDSSRLGRVNPSDNSKSPVTRRDR